MKDSTEKIKNLLKDLLSKMGFQAEVEVFEGELTVYDILCDSASLLIGEDGRNIRSLEFLFKKITSKSLDGYDPFVIDIDGYRRRKVEALKDEVKTFAQRVRIQGREMTLDPLPSFERRMVHMALAEYPDIVTESVGEEPNRRVVIKPFP